MRRPGLRVCAVAALFVSCSAAAFANPDGPAPEPISPRVRGATPRMSQLIERGTRRSSTFAALVAALNRTNVIVYVQETRELPGSVDGHLAVSAVSGGYRYLRAQVLAGLDETDTISIVGHELQHALEVSARAEVTDARSLKRLYARIGIAERAGRFETAAAKEIGRRVRAELG